MVIRFIVFEFLFCNLRFEKPRFYGASEATILYLCFCPLVTRTIRNFQPSPPLSEPGKPLISVPISDFRSPPPTSVRAFARQSGFGLRRRDSLRPLPTFDFRFPISHFRFPSPPPPFPQHLQRPFPEFLLKLADEVADADVAHGRCRFLHRAVGAVFQVLPGPLQPVLPDELLGG